MISRNVNRLCPSIEVRVLIAMAKIHIELKVDGGVDEQDEAEEGCGDYGEVPVELRVDPPDGDGGVDLPHQDHQRHYCLVGRQVLLPPKGGIGIFKVGWKLK